MKIIIYFSAIFFIFLFSYKESEVSAQGLLPFYGGGPVSYSSNRDDDDIGLLLTVLLLAAKNKGNCGGGGCCGCCNCGGNNIPIPYPIPIPTNNPIIMSRYDDDGDAAAPKEPKEVINIVTKTTENVEAESLASDQTSNNNLNQAASDAGAASAT